jgi:tetratricopeptide (TPR) repeat protein
MSDAPTRGSARPNGNIHNPLRRWLLPPTLFRDPDTPESFEGVSILQEIPGDLGLALYQLYRDLLLWALVSEDSRPQLFRPAASMGRDLLIDAAAPTPELRTHLEALATFLRSQLVEPAVATEAALRVSRWAADRGAKRTAIMFAQAASAVSPRLASAALEAGRVAADFGRVPVAETWLRRTIGLGRRARDWESYSEALIVLSRLFWQSPTPENAGRARGAAVVASRVARRHGLRMSGARAHHQLSILALAAGNPSKAEEHARRAHNLYSRQHVEAPAMLHLVAESILAQGRRERTPEAIDLLQRALPHRRSSRDTFGTLLILIRAGGIVGDKRVLESAWFDALTIIERLGDGEDAAKYLFKLAGEAATALEHNRASEAARRALRIATQRRDTELVNSIVELIDRAHLRASAPLIID